MSLHVGHIIDLSLSHTLTHTHTMLLCGGLLELNLAVVHLSPDEIKRITADKKTHRESE